MNKLPQLVSRDVSNKKNDKNVVYLLERCGLFTPTPQPNATIIGRKCDGIHSKAARRVNVVCSLIRSLERHND